MKKMSIAVIVSLVLVGSLTFKYANAENSTNNLNYGDVIQYAINENSDLKILNEKIKLADEKYDDALDEKDEEANTSIETDKRKEVYHLKAKLELENAKWNKEQKQNQVDLEVTKKYYSILIQDELIDLQKQQIQRLEKQLEKKQKEFEAGITSKNSLMDYELILEQSKIKLEALNNEKQKMIMELNINMGREVNQELILEEKEIPYKEYKVDNLDETIKRMRETYYAVTRVEDEIKATVQDKNITQQYNDSDQYDNYIEGLEDKIVNLNYETEDEQKDIEYKIRSDYNNILKLSNEIKIKKLDYDNKVKLLELADTKLEKGLITELEYRPFEEDASNALQDYEKAKLNYYIAIEDFKFFIR
ncbi:TolC family protein [Clostridium ganghwense]|uniref:TolC family protein n=1 Tax=Clostridium ganghwense TaxID=312089 RepID=A0ABT4CQK1_9CLOT|nr:TolC family protein [Clostridium ganghwense]MCY6371335.1 TolC family protein [Clostridium ganghwense]